MRLKVLKMNFRTLANEDVEHASVFLQACKEAGLNTVGAKYHGCGVWELPSVSFADFEQLTGDLFLATQQFSFIDALEWLDRKERLATMVG